MSFSAPTRQPSAYSDQPSWSLETLLRMDWKRFQELVSLVLARSGLVSEVLWVRPDGTTMLAVLRKSRSVAGESLVQCAGWHGNAVGAGELLAFYKAVVSQGAVRGIYVTPGDFDPNARLLAGEKNLELIDGAEFLRTIGRMTPDDQQTLLRMAVSGAWDVPSCPACGGKMAMKDLRFPEGAAMKDLRDVTYRESKHVGDRLFCRHLVVKSGASVLFLTGVEAETIHVDGRIMGNIVCRGKLTVGSKATVSGLVAARSIQLEPGGLLEAEARILNAHEIQPVLPQPQQTFWACPTARCQGSLPLRTLA